MPLKKQQPFTKKVTDLPDVPSPTYTANDIKEHFQTPSDELMDTINKLVDDLEAQTAAGDIGALDGTNKTTVQSSLNKLNTEKASNARVQATEQRITKNEQDITSLNNGKTSVTGDHRGTWQGKTISQVETDYTNRDSQLQTDYINRDAQITQRVNQIVASAGNSNTEIVDARGGEPVLSSRLNKVDAQLAERATDVKNFGAKGDGITDDTQAIQNAIDYANSIGGGEVFFPKGNYLCGDIYLKSNVTLNGVLGTVKLICNKLNVRFVNIIDVSNVVIKGIHIDNTYPHNWSQSRHSVQIVNSNNVHLDTISVDGPLRGSGGEFRGDSLYIAGDTPQSTFNIHVKNSTFSRGSRGGIAVVNGRNMHFNNVTVLDDPSMPIRTAFTLTPNPNEVVEDVFVTDCYFEERVSCSAWHDNAITRNIKLNNVRFKSEVVVGGNAENITLDNVIPIQRGHLWIDAVTSSGKSPRNVIVQNSVFNDPLFDASVLIWGLESGVFNNCKIYQGRDFGLRSTSFGANFVKFIDCEFDNATISVPIVQEFEFVRSVYKNSGTSMIVGNANTKKATIDSCKLHDNNGMGIQVRAEHVVVSDSHIYRNVGRGIYCGDAKIVFISDTHIFENNSHAIEIYSGIQELLQIQNNLFYDLRDTPQQSDVRIASSEVKKGYVTNNLFGRGTLSTSSAVATTSQILVKHNYGLAVATRGATNNRPTDRLKPDIGHMYFDTTLNKPIFWTGVNWVDGIGTVV